MLDRAVSEREAALRESDGAAISVDEQAIRSWHLRLPAEEVPAEEEVPLGVEPAELPAVLLADYASSEEEGNKLNKLVFHLNEKYCASI